MQRMVTVTATGTVNAKPDAARIMSGVQTESSTAREALDLNNKSMSNLIDGLKALGVEARDIQTTGVNLNPRYQHHRDGRPAEVNGYQVNNEVNVVIRDLERIGDILDKMVSLGANQMRGLSFFMSDEANLSNEARKAAIATARERAELYAAASGATVGKVLEIRESPNAGSGPRPMFEARTAAAAPVPIEAGETAVGATVTVTWALE